jgi:uncharacterized protein YgbK (DUF1537 family)
LTARIAFYGDDFTGATDTLATAACAGLRTMLFLKRPTPAEIDAAGPLDCLGVAGIARSLAPEQIAAEVEPAGRLFAALGVPVVHYKTCSTFDSAPEVGSIGAAVAALRPHVANRLVPIVGGQPNLGRYCLFGNLFAAAEALGPVFRIDRHPTMRAHPVTPMAEADLRVHLGAQGLRRVESVAYTDYARTEGELDAEIERRLAGAPDAVLFDVGETGHLAPVGRLIWAHAQRARLLAVGPSSVVQALAAHWLPRGAAAAAAPARARGPVFILAGSLSPVTTRQIESTRSFVRVPLDPARLAANDEGYLEAVAAELARSLRAGRHVLAHTSRTPTERRPPAQPIAAAGGAILERVLASVPLGRVGVAGGDTSSHALRALDIAGLAYLGQLAPGVPLCRAHAPGSPLDGLELMLKGGQMGGPDLFERLIGPA